jgi:hypothetical protein
MARSALQGETRYNVVRNVPETGGLAYTFR